MKVLVLGGTGTVGSATVQGLLARKVDVTVLTRKAGADNLLFNGANIGESVDISANGSRLGR